MILVLRQPLARAGLLCLSTIYSAVSFSHSLLSRLAETG